MNKSTKNSLPARTAVGIKLADYSSLAQANHVAVIQNGWQAMLPIAVCVLLVDAKEKSGQLKTNLAI